MTRASGGTSTTWSWWLASSANRVERWIHARQRLDDVVLLHADAPPVGRAVDLAAERLREQLMPEADADVLLLLGHDRAVQLLGVREPGHVVVGREPAR